MKGRAVLTAGLIALLFVARGGGSSALSVEQMRADLAAFRSEFFARDRAYSSAARAEAETRLAALEAALARTTAVEFELSIARIVALADNGHTMSFAAPRARRFNRVPIRVTPFGEDFRVLRAVETTANLLGARFISIDGHPLTELRAVARTLAGGIPAWRDRFASFFFESPEQMHALGLATKADAAMYTFETLDGRHVERRLSAANPDAPTGSAARWLYPELLTAEQGVWRAVLSVSQAPWSLAEPDVPFRSHGVPEINAVVVQLRQTNDAPGQPIRDFLREMTNKLNAEHPQHVVLDMRLNGGGDLNTARAFMKSLPELVPGRVFVLTSPWTFSAAISSVGYLKQAAPTRVTIVGEPVGDRLNFFAEGRPVFLPNSGIGLLPATERHDYQTGCRGFQDCHGPVVQNPIAVPTLAPDLAVPWTIQAYVAGRDPAMDAVAIAIRGKQ